MCKSYVILVTILVNLSSLAAADEEYAFTVDFDSIVKVRETCRSFKNLNNRDFKGNPFDAWCPAKGKSVFLCSGEEKFYLLKFPDKSSCEEVLAIMKNHAKK